MDAAQILMMPMAAPTPITTLSPDPGAAQTSGELSELFSDLLAQTVVTQAVAQQIPELDTTTAMQGADLIPAGVADPKQERAPADLLMQGDPSEPDSSSTLQMAAVYAQLATLQAPPVPLIPQEYLPLAALEVSGTPAAGSLTDLNAVAGYEHSVVSGLGGVHQNHASHVAIAPDLQAQPLQGKELAGVAAALPQTPLKSAETKGTPQEQETAARQTENRQQSMVSFHADSHIQELPPLAQPAGDSRVPEQQTMTQQAGDYPGTGHQPVVKTAGNNHTIEQQQPVMQPSGGSRAAEQPPVTQPAETSRIQHQQAAAQVQVVQSQGPQDAAKPSKLQSTAQAQPFRFAQSQEVAVAAADGGRHRDGLAGQQQSPHMSQSSLVVESMPDESLVEHATPFQQAPAADEHHQLAVQPGTRPQAAVTVQTAVDDLPKQVSGEQVARQVAERLGSHEIRQGSDQISLKLSPEHLGNLQLNLRMEEQGLKLEIIAEQRGVRDALLRQGDELKETLARQNIRIDSFDVSTGAPGGQTHQQQREWRQMNPEQRIYHAQYASAARGGGTVQDSSPRVLYFAPQYQSTLDVRF